MSTARVRLVLFDLDGTLVDSAPDIAHAANQALADVGHTPRPLADIRAFIGNGAERLIHRCLTGARDTDADPTLQNTVYLGFQTHYAACLLERTRPYPGVEETLATLAARDVLLGCVTNKPERFTKPLLQGLGLARYFSVTLAGDSLAQKKPDPAPLQRAAQDCAVPVADTVMVGDSLIDLAAARAAHMRIFCVGYGYAADVELARHHPDAYIDRMQDILALI